MKRMNVKTILKRTKPALTVGLSALAIAMAMPVAMDFNPSSSFDLIASAYAADDHDHASGGGGKGVLRNVPSQWAITSIVRSPCRIR